MTTRITFFAVIPINLYLPLLLGREHPMFYYSSEIFECLSCRFARTVNHQDELANNP